MIVFGSDHAGFFLKNFLFQKIKQLNFSVLDCGVFSDIHSVDYPDFAFKVVKQLKRNQILN